MFVYVLHAGGGVVASCPALSSCDKLHMICYIKTLLKAVKGWRKLSRYNTVTSFQKLKKVSRETLTIFQKL